jgi:type IV pilus assembly protein PilC
VTTATSVNITDFIGELALLLESGISCGDALKIVQQEQENPAMQKLIAAIITDIENDMSLADSFAKYPHYFEPFLVEMLQSGGNEEPKQTATLVKIAKYREYMDVDAADLTKKIAYSSTYILFLFLVFFALTTILIVYVVPVFADMFSSFGGELPGLTQFVVDLSDFFVASWLFIMGGMLIVGGLIWMKWWQTVTLYIPLFGRLYRKIALIRGLRTCAFMLSEGASSAKAFAAAAQIVNNPVYAKQLSQVSQQVAEGMSLSSALHDAHLAFPKKIVHAAAVGTQTDKLDKLLAKLADFYTKQLHQATEPTIKIYTFLLTLFIGIILGLFVISMYMPIFSMGDVI